MTERNVCGDKCCQAHLYQWRYKLTELSLWPLHQIKTLLSNQKWGNMHLFIFTWSLICLCSYINTICVHIRTLRTRVIPTPPCTQTHTYSGDSETERDRKSRSLASINALQMGVNPLPAHCDYCFLQGPFLMPLHSSFPTSTLSLPNNFLECRSGLVQKQSLFTNPETAGTSIPLLWQKVDTDPLWGGAAALRQMHGPLKWRSCGVYQL